MRRWCPHPYVDRPILLRAIATINKTSLASAKAVADELRISQEDARELLVGEVAEGYLLQQYSPSSFTHTFLYYVLTAQGESVIGAAA